MFKRIIAFLSVIMLVVSLAACTSSTATDITVQAPEPAAASEKTAETSAQPAAEPAKAAEATEKVESIVIAYLPNESKEELTEYRKGVAADMEKALGVKVTEFLASDYNATIEAMRTGKADIANFGPLSYTQAVARAKAECLVAPAPEGKKENMGYYSYIVTQANNDKINSIADLKDKKFAFVDANSTSGNLVPSFQILEAVKDLNLTFEDLHTNGKFFTAVSFSGAHQNGLQAVIKGDIDAAPVASDIYDREIKEGRADASKVKIIFKSPKIAGSPIGIRGDLPAEFKQKVKEFYLNYDNAEYFEKFVGLADGKPQKYVEVTDDDYKDILALREKFGL